MILVGLRNRRKWVRDGSCVPTDPEYVLETLNGGLRSWAGAGVIQVSTLVAALAMLIFTVRTLENLEPKY